MTHITRRAFLASTAAMAAASRVIAQPEADETKAHAAALRHGPIVISSLNGRRATERAMELLKDGYDPADAVVQGVRVIEDDPTDDSVGFGGLPNADGVVELDASVMHGPTHKSGAVASIRNIKHPAAVALVVLRKTDHCLLVGEGAYRFAISQGFTHEESGTEHSRREFLKWRHNMSPHDDWLGDDEQDAPVGRVWEEPSGDAVPRRNDGPEFKVPAGGGDKKPKPFITEVTGTVHVSALTAAGDLASCTSTSGLNWKIPGRVGDSPIIGAGNYCDNDIGAAGSTGRGEANIVTLASARIVDFMGDGLTPTQACLKMCKFVADHTKEKRLRREDGRPNFDLKFYALRKDGVFGGASIFSGAKMAAHDGLRSQEVAMEFLYER